MGSVVDEGAEIESFVEIGGERDGGRGFGRQERGLARVEEDELVRTIGPVLAQVEESK